MVWSEHEQPYGLYENKSGEPTCYRFRHRRMRINADKGKLNFPGWVVGHDALSGESDDSGVIVHLFAPRFVVHWTASSDAASREPGWMKHRSLAVYISQPLPLDEISEETLADMPARIRWLDEACAAVARWRGDICEFLPEDAPDFDEDDIGDGTRRLIPCRSGSEESTALFVTV